MLFKKGHSPTKEIRRKMSLAKKGKSYEEIYGIDGAKKKKMEISKSLREQYLSGKRNNSGKNHPQFGKHHSIEHRKKISKTLIGHPCYKNKERGRNISKALKGKKNPKQAETMKRLFKEGKIQVWNKGGKMTKEFIEKDRISHLGKNWPDKTREKMMNNIKINPNFGMKNKKHKEESINKIKEWRKTFVYPIVDTTIEVKIQNFLKQLGIEFFTHQYMKIEHGYQCDVLIPSMNLVIECDGNYWHKYPIGNEKDILRTQELLDKGFRVLRFWESEIRVITLPEFRNKLEVINN